MQFGIEAAQCLEIEVQPDTPVAVLSVIPFGGAVAQNIERDVVEALADAYRQIQREVPVTAAVG
ncbi:hypothetical protein [Marinobacterium aestuariivivens]|uniref:Uncharacterized protein n=1 Tax=Marinobacterium aestuariivivens TaxID=1698799 RepID=A0ABW1ZX25_9GAMM